MDVVSAPRGSLHRFGCPTVRGIVLLRPGLRPSLTILSEPPNTSTLFNVLLARTVVPKIYGRDVRFSLPVSPFDACRLTFDDVHSAADFYKTLLEIEAAIPPDSLQIQYRPSAGLNVRDRPRPISAQPSFPPNPFQHPQGKIRPAEAPGALLAPPPPPRRDASLRKDGGPPPLPAIPRLPSPKSSSLPSTSTVTPDNFRFSRSLGPEDMTLVPTTPTPPTPATPTPLNPFGAFGLATKNTSPITTPKSPTSPKPALAKPSLPVSVDVLEPFYPSDITLIRHLERGSQGAVDLVSTKFYRRVAMKYFDRRVKQWESAATRELFSLLKTVTHPNIVQSRGVLFASPTERDKPLGVLMEYMDCGSVFSAIYDKSFTIHTTTPLNWCRQAASALAFLHRRRLVHRDVKPANMLLCEGGQKLKISDFGLCAKMDVGMTADVGTVIYMAPEVVASHSTKAQYDEKCDVYSLGVSLWEMCHRRRPHEGVGFLALLSAVRDGSRPEIDPECCSPKLAELIQRMWSEASASRPDMEEVHEEVNKMLDMLGFFEIYE